MCASTLLFTLLGTDLVASWAHFGSSWECFGNFLGEIWDVEQFLEPTSEHLSSQLGYKHFVPCFFGFCVHLGASWEDVECTLGALGSDMETSWRHAEQFLEPTSEHLSRQLGYKHFVPCFFGSCVYPGASWNDLGRILEPVGAILGSSWNLLGDLGIILEPLLRIL